MRVAALSLDMAETFDQVGEQIKQLIDYDRLGFGFIRAGDDHLELYAITGTNIETRVTRVPLHSSVIGEAVKTRRPILPVDIWTIQLADSPAKEDHGMTGPGGAFDGHGRPPHLFTNRRLSPTGVRGSTILCPSGWIGPSPLEDFPRAPCGGVSHSPRTPSCRARGNRIAKRGFE